MLLAALAWLGESELSDPRRLKLCIAAEREFGLAGVCSPLLDNDDLDCDRFRIAVRMFRPSFALILSDFL